MLDPSIDEFIEGLEIEYVDTWTDRIEMLINCS